MRSLIALLAAVQFLAACETLKGAGRDVEDAGEGLEDVVEG